MVEEQCQQGCKWFQCFFPMAELAMFCNSLVCRWQQHHHNDQEEMTGITAQAEGQAEITVMNMMVTEEAEGTDPTSNHREK
jgi:hypothetical protein